ncbi:MAG: homocysteine methyltransferase, partial [Deltaproteobacteria bacterium]|nr:homocysteine methyltransferase [Deltaproteobacteria bacterium]
MHAILELAKKKTVIFDGAMGTMLMAAGLKAGESPELWNIEKPSLVAEIHRQYYEAGSDAVHTNTFGGNAVKLADRGLAEKTEKINVEAARLAREACPAGKFVAGDIGPTGKLLKPLGDLAIEEAEEAFFRQAQALVKGGVDVVSIETMFSLQEALAALRAAKKLGDVTVIASLTFNRTKKGFFTMMGEGVKQAVSAFEEAGADVIASNCSLGSRDMIDLTKELRAATRRPVLVQPNAGKPETQKGVTFYRQTPAEFAQDCREIRSSGADMIGGCCGTNPEFIRSLVHALGNFP